VSIVATERSHVMKKPVIEIYKLSRTVRDSIAAKASAHSRARARLAADELVVTPTTGPPVPRR
jgi:hypothetical protein